MTDPHMIGFEKEELFSQALVECRKTHSDFDAETLRVAIQIACLEFVDGLHEVRPCTRKLKFIGYTNWGEDAPEDDFDSFFEIGKIYESVDFNGGTYSIAGHKNRIGCCYFDVIG